MPGPSTRFVLPAVAFWVIGMIPAQAQSISVNGTIAYTVCDHTVGQNQVCDIWAMNADGTGQVNLTNTPEVNETGPAWSPDGTRIAYSEGFSGSMRIMVMYADGSGRAAVTARPADQFGPSWSPGGTQLAFTRKVPGTFVTDQYDVFVTNVDGTGELNITASDSNELNPAWSPDGNLIAFAGVRPEKMSDGTTAAEYEIVVVAPNGSGEQILSAGDAGSLRAQQLEDDRAPRWSPDGSALVFMSQITEPCCPPWQLWRVNRDGTGAALVSNNPAVNDMWPSYSPDGTQIVFSSDRDANYGTYDIYTMAAPGTTAVATATLAPTRLTTGGASQQPAWARKPGTQTQPAAFALYVSVDLQGKGTGGAVSSVPAGIRCGRDCSEPFAANTIVTLTATAKNGSSFSGWSGACTGMAPTCSVEMKDVRTVKAAFMRAR